MIMAGFIGRSIGLVFICSQALINDKEFSMVKEKQIIIVLHVC